MVLARSGNDEVVLAVITSAIGLGSIAGALPVLAAPTSTRKTRVIFLCYLLSFVFGDVLFPLGSSVTFLAATAFMSALFVPAITANAEYFWRTIIPIEQQARAFATRYLIQSGAVPVGILAGGLLADFVFEPFMEQPPFFLSRLFGTGNGAGMALMFFVSGLIGVTLSWACMRPWRKSK
jgi:predicted MFS family arabinose efflux permease